MNSVLGVYSGGIWRIPYLDSFLPGERVRLSPFKAIPANVNAIAVWGYRPSAQKPAALAQAAGLPVIRLEDGFIRSLGLGVQDCPPLSIVIDRLVSITMPLPPARWKHWYRTAREIARWQMKPTG